MAEGLTKKELEKKRVELVKEINTLELKEKMNSSLIHDASAEKLKLRKEIISAKNYLIKLDKLIKECGPIMNEVTLK